VSKRYAIEREREREKILHKLHFTDFNDASIEHLIKSIQPKLQFYKDLTKNFKILQALLELNVQNDDEYELLSDKYKNLLTNKQNLEEKYKSESSNLNRLIGILMDLYIDKNKFKGINVKNKLEAVAEALHHGTSDMILETYCE